VNRQEDWEGGTWEGARRSRVLRAQKRSVRERLELLEAMGETSKRLAEAGAERRVDRHRLLIVPRWGAGPEDDWYPWLLAEVGRGRSFAPAVVADMPRPDEPVIEDWVARLSVLAGKDPAALANTVLVGHSVGCRAVLHFLAGLSPGLNVRGTLMVAGWWTVDEPWETLLPWIERPIDLDRARESAGEVRVLVSDNDPFTSDQQTNTRLWRERLGAAVRLVSGAEHFNSRREAEVLAELERLGSPPGGG